MLYEVDLVDELRGSKQDGDRQADNPQPRSTEIIARSRRLRRSSPSVFSNSIRA
jgi:hypothetical protein